MSGYPGAYTYKAFNDEIEMGKKLLREILSDITQAVNHDESPYYRAYRGSFFKKMALKRDEIEEYLTKDIQDEQGTEQD